MKNDDIPVAFAFKKDERKKAVYKKTRSAAENINKKGWKVCHKNAIGLNKQKKIEEVPIAELEEHFRRFISPSNMFLVPKKLSGLGELIQVIDLIKNK